MLIATHVQIFPYFRSGTFKISVACLQRSPKLAGLAETSLPARTPPCWKRFTLRPTAWLRSPWRRGCLLYICSALATESKNIPPLNYFEDDCSREVSKLQKITDDSEDCLLQRIHSTLSPCRHVILDFFFFFLLLDDCTSVVHLYLLFILLSVSCGRTRIRSGLAVSHNEPVTCCGFSQEFRQVVSCCEGSVSKSTILFHAGRVLFSASYLFTKASDFRLLKSGTLTLGTWFLSLVAHMTWPSSHVWLLTPQGGGICIVAFFFLMTFDKIPDVDDIWFLLFLQACHRWKGRLFEDLEL